MLKVSKILGFLYSKKFIEVGGLIEVLLFMIKGYRNYINIINLIMVLMMIIMFGGKWLIFFEIVFLCII